jgi:hypothetical protein
VDEQPIERVTLFDQSQDDPLFREHLDDEYFDPNDVSTPNFFKRLICEFLCRSIDNEIQLKVMKMRFLEMMAEERVTLSQLF